jgi:serine/threonine protein kinase
VTPAADTDDVYTGYAPPDPVAVAREGEAVARDLGARYAVRGFVARGGFASVWAVTDRTTGTELAAKRLDPRLGRRRDFYRELRAMFVVAHPNVVRIVNVLETGGTRYLLLELCRGGSLRAAVSKARRAGAKVDPRAARQIVGLIARGLAAVHARGFTHRDLKPENVLFGDRVPDPLQTGAVVKLADFGLTDLLAGDDAGALRSITGSPAYMAPEQFAGAPVPASDVYALGVVALELLTGDVPFEGTAEELALQHLNSAPRLPRGLPTAWAELLPAMLAKDPAARPTAAAVADALGWGEPAPYKQPVPTPAPAETRAVTPNTPNERDGLAREARRAKSALDDLAALARPKRAAAPPPAAREYEPPPPPVSADGFFDNFDDAPPAPAADQLPTDAPAAPSGDWFGDAPAEEPPVDADALLGSLTDPNLAANDTLSHAAPVSQQHTPPSGTPAPNPEPSGIDEHLDSFQW